MPKLHFGTFFEAFLVRKIAASARQNSFQDPMLWWAKFVAAASPTGGRYGISSLIGIAQRVVGSDSEKMKFRLGWLRKAPLSERQSPNTAEVVVLAESATHKARGDDFFKQGLMEEAVNCYRQSISIDPSNAAAYGNLGNALRELKQFGEAERCYNQASVVAPDLVEPYFNFGSLLQELGRLDEAIAKYRRALELKPELEAAYLKLVHALFQSGQYESARNIVNRGLTIVRDSGALNVFLGNLNFHESNLEQAIVCYRKALSLQPNNVAALSNLGRVLRQKGSLQDAVLCFVKATALTPRDANLHYEMAAALQQQERLDEAVASYKQAISLKPDYADAYLYLGDTLQRQKKLGEARICCEKALTLMPESVIALNSLGFILRDQGHKEEALRCFKKSIALDPENGMAQHMIAMLSGNNPEHASTKYVEMLFDGYAENFDSHLVKRLAYETPRVLTNLILRHSVPGDEGSWRVLDLGCGTGLVGVELAQYARKLVGVDLSSKMLEKARARNLYHHLAHMDVLAMMLAEPDMSYDLITASDVLIYVGKLEELVVEAHRLLPIGGKFSFSIESPTEKDTEYQLDGHTGRYTHSVNYLVRLATENGFTVLEMMPSRLRINEGKPVHGHLGLWEKRV